MINLIPSRIRKRLFILYALLTRAMTLGVRVVLVDGENRVLLVRHTYVEGWFLPGGGVERNETLAVAAAKELIEETKIRATSPLRHFHTYKNIRTSRFDHVAVFICDTWEPAGTWEANSEIAEIGFFALDELPQETKQPTRERLLEVFQDKPASDIW